MDSIEQRTDDQAKYPIMKQIPKEVKMTILNNMNNPNELFMPKNM